MDRMRLSAGALCMLAAFALAGCNASAEQSSGTVRIPEPMPATPASITLVNVVQVVGVAPPDYLWTRLGDATGRTLYVSAADSTPGVSSCAGDCAKQFPPLLATAGATGFGDWSLVKRPEGGEQWAYQGKPLYTFVPEAATKVAVGMLVAQGMTEGKEKPAARRRAAPSDLPQLPAGWTPARFNPEKNLVLPAPITVTTLAVQDGLGDALSTAQGLTLYGFDGDASAAAKAACVQPQVGKQGCGASFQPYLAPEIASAVADFSIVKIGPAGALHQWAYRGAPLYTFSADHKSTDAYGVYENYGPWRVMFVYLDAFPQNVQAIESVGHDKILADSHGMPIYERAAFRELFGGPTAYHDYGAAPYMGIAMGSRGCDEGCLKVRRPVLAPANAKSQGDWMVYTREDGTKQWAFQGFALYTYTRDSRPGFVNGHNVSDFYVGDAGPYKISDSTVGDAGAGGMGDGSHKAGFFWFVSHPDWLGR